ncbi:putative kelch-type beta propeller [Dioscorea sansibarensis]
MAKSKRGADPDREESSGDPAQLIPGLPNDIAEQCLTHLPFPSDDARFVCSSWYHALPAASLRRSLSSSALPYLFVFSFHRPSLRLHWLALHPQSPFSWLPIPPMPLPSSSSPPIPSSFAIASLPRSGLLFVLGGMLSGSLSPLSTLLLYRASTNSWLLSSPMPSPRAFFSAAAIAGCIVVAGGDSRDSDTSVDRYDPNTNHWSSAAPMPQTLPLYDSAVIGHRFFVTGGWTWPFDDLPRGSFYDADKDTWEEMQRGMREGWTGVSAVVSGRLLVVSECGEARVKAYDVEADTWRKVDGGSVPAAVGRPYAVCGGEGKIHVVGSGLDVAVGRVVVDEGEGGRRMRMEWEVIKAPDEYAHLAPISCQLIYA